jgi:hypothetical protein
MVVILFWNFCVDLKKNKNVSRIRKKTFYLQYCIRFFDGLPPNHEKNNQNTKYMFQANSSWSSSTQNPKKNYRNTRVSN